MPSTDAPLLSTASDEEIEANIEEARLNNEKERTLTVEAPGGPVPLHATEVPRDNELRTGDVTPIGYSPARSEARMAAEREVAMGPYVGPINGEGKTDEEQEKIRLESTTGGAMDEDGNRLMDPGIGPDYDPRAVLPGLRDEDGNLIADHDGDGIAAADEGPMRETTGVGVSPEASEEEQHGSRGLQDAPRDLDQAEDEAVAPEHDPDASEEEQKGGRGVDDRDLGDAEDAGQAPEYSEFLDAATISDEAASMAEASKSVGAEAIEKGVIPSVDPADVPTVNENPGQPTGEAATEASPGPAAPRDSGSAAEWRAYARAVGVQVSDSASRASVKAALHDAGHLK